LNAFDELDFRRRVAEEAAKAAGGVHMRHRGRELVREVHADERADYSTVVDREAERAVRETIASYFPSDPLIGEEDGEGWDRLGDLMAGGCWLTDPLDGTLEFVHGSPGFSSIVSYVREGRPLDCGIYFAAWGELFSAAEGQGATLNGGPIKVSGRRELRASLFATPHRSTDPARARQFSELMARLLPHVEAFRIPGAPSVMACAVAAGRYDICSFLSPRQEPAPGRPFAGQPWETAAFILLVKEAGGAVQRFGGGAPDILGHNAYAASEELLEQFFAVMAGG
jgi:myo-inositol-1(or 4)-monophosphatase